MVAGGGLIMEGSLVALLLADIGFVVITIFSVFIYVGRKLSKIDQHDKWIEKHDAKSDKLEQRLDQMGIDIAKLSTNMENVKDDIKDIKKALKDE